MLKIGTPLAYLDNMVKIIEDVIDFLKSVPPFEFLSEEVINSVTVKTSMEYYPKGTHILLQDGPPSEFLYVIKKRWSQSLQKS